MYKPNGEDLMNPLEEMEARERMSKKKKTTDDASPTIDSLRSALYSAMYGARANGSREALDPCDLTMARNSR
jgi:hypothetical protein